MVLAIKNILFTLVIPGTVGVYIPLWIAGQRAPTGGAGWTAAMVLFVIGGGAYAWCVWDFATFGRATPAPIDAPRKLIVRGLYRYSRNPMYVSVLTVILGWTVMYRAWSLTVYAVGVAALFHAFVVLHEEPALRRAFGDEYEHYCRRVGRWLPRRSGV